MSVFISMAAFALAASISPGPVNIVALSYGRQFGFGPSQNHVLGATLGFVVLLLFTGFGLHEILQQWPLLTELVRWGGMAFLLYLAWKLAADNGRIDVEGATTLQPSFMHGVIMQWLNPKAWLAAIAGMGAFVANGEAMLIGSFALIYCVVCYVSIACWAYAGAFLNRYLHNPPRIRLFNRCIAVMLSGCAVSLLWF